MGNDGEKDTFGNSCFRVDVEIKRGREGVAR
jgi:hypothetical protein